VVDEADWEGDEYEDDTNEFTRCPDGYYWQHRPVRMLEVMGDAFGPIQGPFACYDEAKAHRDRHSSELGTGDYLGYEIIVEIL